MRNTLFTIAGLMVIGTFSTANAGPPLICQPYSIGDFKSLPWGSGNGWDSPDAAYDVKHLNQDTLALLNPGTPILARMETMRRAAIYTSADHAAGRQLLQALRERTSTGTGALAYFDYGYFVESLKQMEWRYKEELSGGVDGYALVKKALTLDPASGEMHFAAAMMTSSPFRPSERQEHLRKAREAKGGGLLAQNLASHFQSN